MRQSRKNEPKDQDLQDLGKALATLALNLAVLYMVRRVDWLVRVLVILAVLNAAWTVYMLYVVFGKDNGA